MSWALFIYMGSYLSTAREHIRPVPGRPGAGVLHSPPGRSNTIIPAGSHPWSRAKSWRLARWSWARARRVRRAGPPPWENSRNIRPWYSLNIFGLHKSVFVWKINTIYAGDIFFWRRKTVPHSHHARKVKCVRQKNPLLARDLHGPLT